MTTEPNAAEGQTPGPHEEHEPFPTPKIRIGTQRRGSPRIEAKPQIEPTEPQEQRKKFPPPNKRQQLSPELEAELQEALGNASLDELVKGASQPSTAAEVELESRHQARVVSIHREDVFVDFGQRNQGVVPLKQFEQPPEPGQIIDVVVGAFDAEEGLYQLTKPGAAQSVQDWGD